MFTFPQLKLCILIYPYFFEYLLDCSAKGYSTLILYFSNHALEKSVKVKDCESQSCPTLCDPMDCIVHGILQARTLEWVTFPFSRGSSQPRGQTQVSLLQGIFPTRGLNPGLPSPGDLPYPGIDRGLLHCRQILYQLSYEGSQSEIATKSSGSF